jgi:tricorn protease
MRVQIWFRAVTLAVLSVVLAQPARAHDWTFMRFPTLHGNRVVFEAHGNLWQVSRWGGTASRLTADPGYDLMPRFSPDGNWIAFTGSYQGNQDVYVIPSGGGAAQRLTFHSDVVEKAPTRWGPDNMVLTWTPDSKNIVFLSRRQSWTSWFGRPYEVPLGGGLATPLPLDRGGLMTFSPDGKSIAYNRIFRTFLSHRMSIPTTSRPESSFKSRTGRAPTRRPCGTVTASTFFRTAIRNVAKISGSMISGQSSIAR